MNQVPDQAVNSPLALWGGLECTLNRVRDNYFSRMGADGIAARMHDVERIASLGIGTVRYPVLWEHTARDGVAGADWTWPDACLPALQRFGVAPLLGLHNHGRGPRHASLPDPGFASQLAAYALAVARRYPWVRDYTPVYAPLASAGPTDGGDERRRVRALLGQCRATVLAMRAIRQVNPKARLVHTDELAKFSGTAHMARMAGFLNERRWLSWDLLCGKVGPGHALWDYLCANGADAGELLWFRDNPCRPGLIGVNYHPTSERWLDHRAGRYPERYRRSDAGGLHADIEAARALAPAGAGLGPLLKEAWERYRLPLAVTEAHIAAPREEQMRWLQEAWDAAEDARRGSDGADVRAVTASALLGSCDWNCPPAGCNGYYEPGPFDVRQGRARATALAGLMRELASGRAASHPVLQGQGWWRRPGRFHCTQVASGAPGPGVSAWRSLRDDCAQPILISGASGALGAAFARICRQRNLAHRILGRQEMDIGDPASVQQAIDRYQPWAVIGAGARCVPDHLHGRANLMLACLRHGLRFSAISHRQDDAEHKLFEIDPQALVVRAGALSGPDRMPDLVHACLDLLVDREQGVWQLTDATTVTWGEQAFEARAKPGERALHCGPRPGCSASALRADHPLCAPQEAAGT